MGWWLRQVVVDQIDAGIAAVELPNLTVLYVSVEALPEGAREGDTIQLSRKSTRDAGVSRRRRDDES